MVMVFFNLCFKKNSSFTKNCVSQTVSPTANLMPVSGGALKLSEILLMALESNTLKFIKHVKQFAMNRFYAEMPCRITITFLQFSV